MFGPLTCVAGNEGSGSLVVLLVSVDARGERLRRLDCGEKCVELIFNISTLVDDGIIV